MNKAFKLGMILLLIFSLTILAACQEKSEKTSTDSKEGQITLKVLHNWAGSSGNEPKDVANNPVTKKIMEETGVKMEFDYPSGSEVEKITQIFATGELPDLYTGPA